MCVGMVKIFDIHFILESRLKQNIQHDLVFPKIIYRYKCRLYRKHIISGYIY